MVCRERLGKAIRQIRGRKRLTQREVAESVGVSVPYISMLENGIKGANLDTLNKLSRALDTPVWKILKKAEA